MSDAYVTWRVKCGLRLFRDSSVTAATTMVVTATTLSPTVASAA
jgi:hypothetical protein